ncbi:MAG: ABC transporter permease, partial [Rhodothermales bacterium]|nr:ABC transporter permease [Rhodothermales bacterium]
MNSQTWIIAQREYFQRLKSKAFIITTAIGPIILLLLIAAPIAVAVFATDETERVVAVVDESGQLSDYLRLPPTFVVDWRTRTVDSLRSMVDSGSLSGYLVLPASLLSGDGEASFYSKGGGGILVGEALSHAVTTA